MTIGARKRSESAQAGRSARLRGGRLGVGGAQAVPPSQVEGGGGEQQHAGAGHDGRSDSGIAEVEAVPDHRFNRGVAGPGLLGGRGGVELFGRLAAGGSRIAADGVANPGGRVAPGGGENTGGRVAPAGGENPSASFPGVWSAACAFGGTDWLGAPCAAAGTIRAAAATHGSKIRRVFLGRSKVEPAMISSFAGRRNVGLSGDRIGRARKEGVSVL